jgi:hypothetical protein
MSKPFLATLLLLAAAGIALGPSACSLPSRTDAVAQSALGLAGAVGDAGPRGNVVIAAVYAGGGAAGSTFKRDFVVLFNRTKSDIPLDDGSLQYAAPLDELGATADKIFVLGGTIKAGSYVLVALQPNQGGQGADVPIATGDIAATTTAGFDLDPAGGKVALVIGSDKAGCGTSVARCTTNAKVVDYVGWGNVADFEGAGSFAALSTTKAAVRKGNGCTDANNNAADFDIVDVATPKNSATTPAVDCTPVTPPRDSGGPVPPVLDPELGDEPPFSEAKRRDAGSGSGASGGSSSSCAATTNVLPSPLPLLALAACAGFLASRRRRS